MTHVPEGDRVADQDLLDDDELRTSGVSYKRAQHCPDCSSRFSSEARFCPYDGNELVPAPDWDPLADPLLGELIDDRYAVIRVLGEGGMGTVYEVRHDKLERHFALKALRRDLAKDPELSQRFIQEARATAAVTHPGIVQITDFGTLDTGQPYFVMELLRGRPLTTVLRDEGPLETQRALTLVRAIADALRAAHAANIIHRDLKPDNIQVMPTASGQEAIKILDFGLARVGSKSRLTKDGFVFGTPHYMSPEQASGEPIDQRADMYSLGVLMYEMFTGTLPFEADTSMGVLTKHIYMAPVPPSEVMPQPTEDGSLERVILRCLEKQREKRFKNMDDLLRQLERIGPRAGDEPGHRDSDGSLLTRVSEPPRILEIRWVSWLAGAAGLAALALAGALLIGPSGGSQQAPDRPRLRSLSTVKPSSPGRPPAPTRAASAEDTAPEAVELPHAKPETRAKSPLKSAGGPVQSPSARPSASAASDEKSLEPRPVPPRATPPTEVIDPWAR